MRSPLELVALGIGLLWPSCDLASDGRRKRHMRAGTAAHQRGEDATAIREMRRALEAAEAFGERDRRLAETLHKLANLFYAQRRDNDAEPLYRRALEIRERELGPEDWVVGAVGNPLADVYRAQGCYREAALLYERLLKLLEKGLGPEHFCLAASLYGLASIHHAEGRLAEAEEPYQRALRIREGAIPEEHAYIDEVVDGRSQLYRQQGRHQEAERVLHVHERASTRPSEDGGAGCKNP